MNHSQIAKIELKDFCYSSLQFIAVVLVMMNFLKNRNFLKNPSGKDTNGQVFKRHVGGRGVWR